MKITKGGKKDLGKNIVLINSICEEAGRFLVCEENTIGLLADMSTID
jgi:hypothetical protein